MNFRNTNSSSDEVEGRKQNAGKKLRQCTLIPQAADRPTRERERNDCGRERKR